MMWMRDVASMAMNCVGTVQAVAHTLTFVYRAIYWPSKCIPASKTDIQLHCSKHFFFLSSIIIFRLSGLGYVLTSYDIVWLRHKTWQRVAEWVWKRNTVTARMQAVERNRNERKFVKLDFILPSTVHMSILLSRELVHVVLERDVFISKPLQNWQRWMESFLFVLHCTLDLFIS